jgi:hypothetical protein
VLTTAPSTSSLNVEDNEFDELVDNEQFSHIFVEQMETQGVEFGEEHGESSNSSDNDSNFTVTLEDEEEPEEEEDSEDDINADGTSSFGKRL